MKNIQAFISYPDEYVTEASVLNVIYDKIKIKPFSFKHEGFVVSTDWEKGIECKIKESQLFILLWGPKSESKWVKTEIQLAEQYDKTILPIIIDTNHPLPENLHNRQAIYANLSDPKIWDEILEKTEELIVSKFTKMDSEIQNMKESINIMRQTLNSMEDTLHHYEGEIANCKDRILKGKSEYDLLKQENKFLRIASTIGFGVGAIAGVAIVKYLESKNSVKYLESKNSVKYLESKNSANNLQSSSSEQLEID